MFYVGMYIVRNQSLYNYTDQCSLKNVEYFLLTNEQ